MNHAIGYYVAQRYGRGQIYLFKGSELDMLTYTMYGWQFDRCGRKGYKLRKESGYPVLTLSDRYK